MSAKKPDSEKVSAVPPFGLRMLPELRDAIAKAAEGNGRSMNAEIVARLIWSFNPAGGAKIVSIEGENIPIQVLAEAFANSFMKALEVADRKKNDATVFGKQKRELK